MAPARFITSYASLQRFSLGECQRHDENAKWIFRVKHHRHCCRGNLAQLLLLYFLHNCTKRKETWSIECITGSKQRRSPEWGPVSGADGAKIAIKLYLPVAAAICPPSPPKHWAEQSVPLAPATTCFQLWQGSAVNVVEGFDVPTPLFRREACSDCLKRNR